MTRTLSRCVCLCVCLCLCLCLCLCVCERECLCVNVCQCLCLCLWGHFVQCAPPVGVEVSDVFCTFVAFVLAMFRSRVEQRVEASGSRDFLVSSFHSRSLFPPSRSLLLWGQDIVWLQLFSSPPRVPPFSPSLPPSSFLPLLLSLSLLLTLPLPPCFYSSCI